MSLPRTVPIVFAASGGTRTAELGHLGYLRVAEATGSFTITWPDGGALEVAGRGRWMKVPPGPYNINVANTSGAANTIKLEVASQASETGDDRFTAVGVVSVEETALDVAGVLAKTAISSPATILATSTQRHRAWIQADPGNTDYIAVGWGNKTWDSSGIKLAPGQAIELIGSFSIGCAPASGTQYVSGEWSGR